MAVYNILLDVGGLYGDQIHHTGDLETHFGNQPHNISQTRLKSFLPSRDLNPGPSTIAADALTTELLDWAGNHVSNR